jgi:hypothetical protein
MTAVEHPVDREELMEYLDGELPVERAAQVQLHVSTCDACQRLSGQLRGLSRDLLRWQVEEPPKTLRAPEPSNQTRARDASWVSWLRPARAFQFAGVAAVALVVIVLGFEKTRRASLAEEGLTPPHVSASVDKPETSERGRSAGGGAGQAHPTVLGLSGAQPPAGPMIARTVKLQIMTSNFGAARPTVDRIVADMGGLIGQVDESHIGAESQSLRATLMIPAGRLDAALAALRALGKVVSESQRGDDVTEQVRDLDARLSNSRSTEKRLIDLLQKRTGDLADVLAAEREVARVREEIERLDAERKNIGRRVTYATVTLEVIEERKAALDLGPLPVSTRFRNALVDGFRSAFQSGLEAALLVIRIGPALLLWVLVLALPARAFLRWRRRVATS